MEDLRRLFYIVVRTRSQIKPNTEQLGLRKPVVK
jgi:hypothetical protein